MILHNCRVLTMDARMPHASALAIAGGRVIGGVDSREDAIASHAHERVDLQGATVVPGLVDAHVHFASWVRQQQRAQLASATTLDDLVAAVTAHAEGLDADAWLVGRGWRDGLLRSEDAGSRLEAVTAGRPTVLLSRDGHAAWANGSALERAGLRVADLQVDGGIVEAGSGVFRERSAWLLTEHVPEPELTTRAMGAAVRDANARGVTAVHDMDGASGFRSWRRLERERGGLGIRVWQHFLAGELPYLEALGIDGNFGTSHLRVGGIKAFADGTLGSGTAWLHAPEATGDGLERSPVPMLDAGAIAEIARRAGEAGLALSVHAIGDAAVTAVVDGLEATRAAWSHLIASPRIEHVQLARPEDLRRCAELGIVLSVQPSHLITDRDVAEARWGDRCEHAYAYRSMLDVGAPLLLGSDAPVEELDPLAAIRAAVARAGDGSQAPWHPEQAISAREALHASTAAIADAVGMSGIYGRLTPGHAADCVVLSDDPLTGDIGSIDVVATMVDGRWVAGRTRLATS